MDVFRTILAWVLLMAPYALGQHEANERTEIVVTTTAPVGPGSLPTALHAANAAGGAARVVFSIPLTDGGYDARTGVWTIELQSPLPPLASGNVLLDGNSQAASVGDRNPRGPEIALSATREGVEHGLALVSASNEIRAIAIGGFKHGIVLWGPGATRNTVTDCFIGVAPDGRTRRSNDIGIIAMAGASRNALTGNVVSGNDSVAIALIGKGTEGNTITGSRIGTDSSGTRILHNSIGIVLKGLANGNVIGGTTATERNIISGNLEIGLYIEASDRNRIVGNYIGTDCTGTRPVTDGALVQGNGVEFNTVAKDNVLGGLGAGERNVISGNMVYGVVYYGRCSRNSTVGNLIGTDVTGNAALPNATGICVDCASHHNDMAQNVISGNLNYGLFFVTRGTEHNTLRGNRVGTNAAGTEALPNDIGMVVSTGASHNVVGGGSAEDRNIISGNRRAGLMITNRLTEHNLIAGNFIGVDATGTKRVPNLHGLLVTTYAARNTLERNVIAGNVASGVVLTEHVEGNVLRENWIGSDMTEKVALPNGQVGIFLDNGAVGNVLEHNSGPAPVRVPRERGPKATPEVPATAGKAVFDDAFRGTWPAGEPGDPPPALAELRSWADRDSGIPFQRLKVTATADSGPGSLRAAIESCNSAGGRRRIVFDIPQSDDGFDPDSGTWWIRLRQALPPLRVGHVTIDGTSQTRTRGDTNAAGPEIALDGNGHDIEYGLLLANVSNVTVRGLAVCHFVYGVQVFGPGANHNRIAGCFVGVAPDGRTARGNYNGIEFLSGAHHNLVGGTVAADRNVIAGNEHIGLRITDANATVVVGNYVGVNSSGGRAVPNADGICIEGRAKENVVGGDRAGERNVVSGNTAYGVDLFGYGVQGNYVLGNYIGTDLAGRRAIPNTYGVLFDDRSSHNVVGGYGEGEGNVISGNTAFGAYFYNNGTQRNVLRGNRIGTDATGSYAIPNEMGVHIDGATRENVVDGNLISGNLVAGVTIFALHTDANVVTGNRIGTDLSGRKPLPNGRDGIRIAFGPKGNRVGGEGAARNVIAFNGIRGIAPDSGAAEANDTSGNVLFMNGIQPESRDATKGTTTGGD